MNGEKDRADVAAAETEDVTKASWLTENLLKNPLKILNVFEHAPSFTLLANMLLINFICLTAYGVIVGSFAGGMQWYMSPLKIMAGLILTMLFCFPSLYIFICLSGMDIKPGKAFLLLLSAISVFSILLVGFAPVAWVFSQSTSTVFFIGFFHLAFWFISTVFGMSVLMRFASSLKCRNLFYPFLWILIFLITSMQMMTALRPMIGKADTVLPKEKMFFLEHWGKLFSETIDNPKR